MNKVITIQVIRPNIKGLTENSKEILLRELSRQIAEQIVFQEEMKLREAESKYWEQYFLEWQIRDIKNELKYGY
jgi:hypothetical protein